ncbi:MAG TPA: hypothetical protein DDZ51_25910, partial [Planctomycetaceae bacterium]|nr:hypothetical protein [Planctomycetaceae bacterium]
RAYGNPIHDSGFLLTVSGLGDLFHYQFETVEWMDGAPLILDDGDVQWRQTGGRRVAGPRVLDGDSILQTNSDNVTVGWDVNQLSPGPYQVSLTWPAIASNIQLKPNLLLRDSAGNVLHQQQVNQLSDQASFQADGLPWYDMSQSVSIADRHLSVDYFQSQVLNHFVADGLKIDRLRYDSPEIRLIDLQTDQSLTSGVAHSNFGEAYFGQMVQRQFRIENHGSAPLVLNLVDQSVLDARSIAGQPLRFRNVEVDESIVGVDRDAILDAAVRPSLPAGFRVAVLGEHVVLPGENTVLTITMDGDSPGLHFGDFLLETNDVNESLFRIALKGTVGSSQQLPSYGNNHRPGDDFGSDQNGNPLPPPQRGWINEAAIQNDSTITAAQPVEFAVAAGSFSRVVAPGAFSGYALRGNPLTQNEVVWTATDLPEGIYRVSATWVAEPQATDVARFQIDADSSSAATKVLLTQRIAPQGYVNQLDEARIAWVDLADNLLVNDGRITVRLSGNAIQVDAIRIQRVNRIVEPSGQLQLTDLATGQPISTMDGVWDFGGVAWGRSAQRSLRLTNVGDAELLMPAAPALGPGFTLMQSVSSATLAPGESVDWLVRFDALTPGAARSQLSLGYQANPQELVDRFVRLQLQGEAIVDFRMATDDPASFEMDGFRKPTGSAIVQGVSYGNGSAMSYRSGDAATWTFSDLEPGAYAVYTTWDHRLRTPTLQDILNSMTLAEYQDWDFLKTISSTSIRPTLATAVPYLLKGSDADSATTIVVDQSKPANDQFDDNWNWRFLTHYAISGDSLTIRIENPNDFMAVQADGVRLVRLHRAAPEFRWNDQPLANAAKIDFATVDLGKPSRQVVTIHNPSPTPLFLQSIQELPQGFSTSFVPRFVAPGESYDLELTLTGQQVGAYGGRFALLTSAPLRAVMELELAGFVSQSATWLNDRGGTIVLSDPIGGDVQANYSPNTFQNNGLESWTLQGLEPGRSYRVSTTWVQQPAQGFANAPFTVTTSAASVTTRYSQVNSPRDVASSQWDQGTWWADIAPSVVVGEDGTLVITARYAALTNPWQTAEAFR